MDARRVGVTEAVIPPNVRCMDTRPEWMKQRLAADERRRAERDKPNGIEAAATVRKRETRAPRDSNLHKRISATLNSVPDYL